MLVVVQHRASDLEGFWAAVEASSAARPLELCLRYALPSVDGRHCVCVWDAPSLEVLHSFDEATLGDATVREYFAVDPSNVLGLDPGAPVPGGQPRPTPRHS